MMLVVKELDLEGLAGLCRLVGGDWLDEEDEDDNVGMIIVMIVLKFG